MIDRAVIEVGANDGRDTQRLYETYKCKVFSFEPVPYLFKELQQKFSSNEDVEIFPHAVCDDDSEMKNFFITATHPKIRARYGASSLFNFREGLREEWDREDFVMKEVIQVPTIRLDTFIELNHIQEVPYLHVDAQGADLLVMKSLGKEARRVLAGVMEATVELNLYDYDENYYEDAQDWLKDNGFRVTRIVPNDQMNAEVNIYFERK